MPIFLHGNDNFVESAGFMWNNEEHIVWQESIQLETQYDEINN